MCWSCGCGRLEDSHHDARALTTETLQGAADQAGTDIPHAVANIVFSLSHYNPALAKETAEAVSGTVLKANDEDRFLLMVAYSPNRMPLRGADHRTDLASPRTLEKACWHFMAKGAKTGMWHEDGHDGEAVCVENYVYRNPSPWVLKHEDGSQTVIKEGDWIVGFILSKAAWDLYKAGEIGGVSMQGAAGRRKPSAETLARVRSDAA